MTVASTQSETEKPNAIRAHLKKLLPGIGVLVVLAIVADSLATVLPTNALVLAIAFGFAIANFGVLPEWAGDGISTHNLWLETGIVLMGARLTLRRVLQIGPKMILIVLVTVLLTLSLGELLARRVFGLPERLGSLIAAGMSICGVSAVIAVSGSIRADSDQIAYAVAAVLLFDAITLITYPLIGQMLHLPERVFGIWAGVSMLSTGPVTAVGFTYSEVAGQWATVTKLTRNTMVGVLAIAYSIYYTQGDESVRLTEKTGILWEQFPKFILGFVGLMVLSSVGVFSGEQIETIKRLYEWFFLMAFVGLGTNIQLDEMSEAGIEPAKAMLATLALVSVVSLLVVMQVF